MTPLKELLKHLNVLLMVFLMVSSKVLLKELLKICLMVLLKVPQKVLLKVPLKMHLMVLLGPLSLVRSITVIKHDCTGLLNCLSSLFSSAYIKVQNPTKRAVPLSAD